METEEWIDAAKARLEYSHGCGSGSSNGSSDGHSYGRGRRNCCYGDLGYGDDDSSGYGYGKGDGSDGKKECDDHENQRMDWSPY